MRTLIIYISYSHGNTEKVAQAIGEVLNAELRSPASVSHEHIKEFDLIGFGSGNYYGKFDARLTDLVENLPKMNGKKAFIFSTSGRDVKNAHDPFRRLLLSKEFKVIGEFNCKGYDTYGTNRLMGGINNGRPNESDLRKAKGFAAEMIGWASN